MGCCSSADTVESANTVAAKHKPSEAELEAAMEFAAVCAWLVHHFGAAVVDGEYSPTAPQLLTNVRGTSTSLPAFTARLQAGREPPSLPTIPFDDYDRVDHATIEQALNVFNDRRRMLAMSVRRCIATSQGDVARLLAFVHPVAAGPVSVVRFSNSKRPIPTASISAFAAAEAEPIKRVGDGPWTHIVNPLAAPRGAIWTEPAFSSAADIADSLKPADAREATANRDSRAAAALLHRLTAGTCSKSQARTLTVTIRSRKAFDKRTTVVAFAADPLRADGPAPHQEDADAGSPEPQSPPPALRRGNQRATPEPSPPADTLGRAPTRGASADQAPASTTASPLKDRQQRTPLRSKEHKQDDDFTAGFSPIEGETNGDDADDASPSAVDDEGAALWFTQDAAVEPPSGKSVEEYLAAMTRRNSFRIGLHVPLRVSIADASHLRSDAPPTLCQWLALHAACASRLAAKGPAMKPAC
jgi:hypothetical protein